MEMIKWWRRRKHKIHIIDGRDDSGDFVVFAACSCGKWDALTRSAIEPPHSIVLADFGDHLDEVGA